MCGFFKIWIEHLEGVSLNQGSSNLCIDYLSFSSNKDSLVIILQRLRVMISKCGHPPVSADKVLLEHGHVQFNECFHPITAELQQKPYGPHSLNNLLSGPFQKKLSTPGLSAFIKVRCICLQNCCLLWDIYNCLWGLHMLENGVPSAPLAITSACFSGQGEKEEQGASRAAGRGGREREQSYNRTFFFSPPVWLCKYTHYQKGLYTCCRKQLCSTTISMNFYGNSLSYTGTYKFSSVLKSCNRVSFWVTCVCQKSFASFPLGTYTLHRTRHSLCQNSFLIQRLMSPDMPKVLFIFSII